MDHQGLLPGQGQVRYEPSDSDDSDGVSLGLRMGGQEEEVAKGSKGGAVIPLLVHDDNQAIKCRASPRFTSRKKHKRASKGSTKDGEVMEDEHARSCYRRSCLAQKLLRGVMELDLDTLSPPDLSTIALLSKRMLRYRKRNTTRLHGDANYVLPLVASYPRIKHLTLVIQEKVEFLQQPTKVQEGLCPQLEKLTLVLTTYDGYLTSDGQPCNVLMKLFRVLGPLRRLHALSVHMRAKDSTYSPLREEESVVHSVASLLLDAPLEMIRSLQSLDIRGLSLGSATKIMSGVLRVRAFPALQSLTLGPEGAHAKPRVFDFYQPPPIASPVSPAFFQALTGDALGSLKSLHLYGPMVPLNHASPLGTLFETQPWRWPALDVFEVSCSRSLELIPYFIVPTRCALSWPTKVLGLTLLAYLPPTFIYPRTWAINDLCRYMLHPIVSSPNLFTHQVLALALRSSFTLETNRHTDSPAFPELSDVFRVRGILMGQALPMDAPALLVSACVEMIELYLSFALPAFFTFPSAAEKKKQGGRRKEDADKGQPRSAVASSTAADVSTFTTLAYHAAMRRDLAPEVTRRAFNVLSQVLSRLVEGTRKPFAGVSSWFEKVTGVSLVHDLVPWLLSKVGRGLHFSVADIAAYVAKHEEGAVAVWVSQYGLGQELVCQWLAYRPADLISQPYLHELVADHIYSSNRAAQLHFFSAVVAKRVAANQWPPYSGHVRHLVDAMLAPSRQDKQQEFWGLVLSEEESVKALGYLWLDLVLRRAYELNIDPPSPNTPISIAATDKLMDSLLDLLMLSMEEDGVEGEEHFFLTRGFTRFLIKLIFQSHGNFFNHLVDQLKTALNRGTSTKLTTALQQALVGYSLASTLAVEEEEGYVVGELLTPTELEVFKGETSTQAFTKHLADALETAFQPKSHRLKCRYSKVTGHFRRWRGAGRVAVLGAGLYEAITRTPALLFLVEGLGGGGGGGGEPAGVRKSYDRIRVLLEEAAAAEVRPPSFQRMSSSSSSGPTSTSLLSTAGMVALHVNNHEGRRGQVLELLSLVDKNATGVGGGDASAAGVAAQKRQKKGKAAAR